MPFTADGPYWTSKKGGNRGLVNGVSPADAKFVPGSHYRVDVMASTGLDQLERLGQRVAHVDDVEMPESEL